MDYPERGILNAGARSHNICARAVETGAKVMRFSLYPDYVTPRFGYCAYIHVFPYNTSVSSNGTAFATVAQVGSGTTSVYFGDGTPCYTGPHLHQSADGSHLADPAPSPASGGNTDTGAGLPSRPARRRMRHRRVGRSHTFADAQCNVRKQPHARNRRKTDDANRS